MSLPHILLADDDRLVLATLGAGLRQVGYRVTEAASGVDALRLCLEDPPDLAVLDVRMPGLSGIELARQLRKHSDVPFVFLSAYGDDDVVRQAAEEGALGYLIKPVDIPQMTATIAAACARAKELRASREDKEKLTVALKTGRDTNMAVGLIMERNRLDRGAAFRLLRSHARSQRRKVNEVATQILDAAEIVSLTRLEPLVAQAGGARDGDPDAALG